MARPFLALSLALLAAAPAWSQTALPVSNTDLTRDWLYLSPTGDHVLLFQTDGDLAVLDTDGRAVWSLGTTGVPVARAARVAMQPDGNLAVYAADGGYLWSALTADPDPAAQLTLSPDGDLQLVTGEGVVWSSRGDGIGAPPPATALAPPTAGPGPCAPAADAEGARLAPGLTPSFLPDTACLERLAHEAANREREQAGLAALRWSDAFAAVARAHSEDMVRRGFFSHDTPEGVTYSARMAAAGLDCSGPRAENIAMNPAIGLEVMDGSGAVASVEWLSRQEIGSAPVVSWIHSPPHRRNLLNPAHTRHAIGVAWDAGARMYRATQLLCEGAMPRMRP